MFARVASTN